ncbi:Lrp/AsnC family transcriptional regulator [Candidatus Woesearchaeota archaeon]|nr:Lrp/AsnC family transcriptional regulator [Candidatus Woesearchaeota archaeon]
MKDTIDEKDKQILALLEEDSKLTSQKISRKTGLPITTVHNRIKKLEKEKIIKKYSLIIDKKKLGKIISACIQVTVTYGHPQKKFSQEEIARKIKALSGAEEVMIVTGGTDILLKINVESIEALNDFIIKKLRNIDGVDKTNTMVILNEF